MRIPLLTCLQKILYVDDTVVANLRAIWQIDVFDYDTAVSAIKAWEAVVDRHLALLETQTLSVLFPSTDDFYRIMMPTEER